MSFLTRATSVVIILASVAMAQDPSTYARERKQAMELYEAQKVQQALPLLEKLAAENPADIGVQERLGMATWASRIDITDPEKRKAQCLKARAAFLKAQELGDNSPLLQTGLAAIPADCSDEGGFSAKKDVDDAMRAAESAYTRGDFEGALQGYARALQLDPTLYSAALYSGDVYFKQKNHDKAAEWFARAIAINPNVETAYRYWGDDLMSQGRVPEAREKFIEAIVAWPYNNRPWLGLKAWAERAKVKLNSVQIKPPNSVEFKEGGNANITIDPASLKDNTAGSAWVIYPISRVAWRNKLFAEKFPGQPYRHTLQEEMDALENVITSARQMQKDKKAKDLDPQLKTLLELKDKGVLEAYILLSAPDQGIAQDYEAYRDQNRAKLKLYLSTYIVPAAPAQ